MNPYHDVAEVLSQRKYDMASQRVVVGFDGFVDDIIDVVSERSTSNAVRLMTSIGEFSSWTGSAAGRNSLREIIVRRQDPGGCAVNLADGLSHLGATVDLFATLGSPPHPAFAHLATRCNALHSFGEVYGRTMSFEFSDGKFMLCAASQLATIQRDLVEKHLTSGAFPAACTQAHVIALTNWSLYPAMTGIWELLRERVFQTLPHRPAFLVDLVDPRGRSRDDQLGMIEELRRLTTCGSVTLSVNLNEAHALEELLALPASADHHLGESAPRLREALAVSEVVIHNRKGSAVSDLSRTCTLAPPYCPSPIKLTGAGDRFNAGYALGIALGLPAMLRLALANTVGSAFVTHGFNHNINELITACRMYALTYENGMNTRTASHLP